MLRRRISLEVVLGGMAASSRLLPEERIRVCVLLWRLAQAHVLSVVMLLEMVL